MSLIVNTDIEFRMSGGLNQGDPSKSLGGPMSLVAPGNLTTTSGTMGALWDFVPLSEATAGLPAEFRCIYVRNINTNGIKLLNVKLWFDGVNVDSNIINSIGLDPVGLNGTAQTIADELTAPINVNFSQPLSKDVGLSLGTINANSFYPFWLKRQITATTTPFYQDSFVIRVEGEPPAIALPPPPGPSPPPPGGGPPPSPPPPGSTGDFAFAAAGKWSCNAAATTSINNIIARKTGTPSMQLFLPGGDISYTTDPTCWFNLTTSIDHITHITLGTMENDTELGAQPTILNNWLHHYGLTTQYYSFDYLDVHFLILATEIPYDTTSLQYKFAVADLTAAQSNSAIDWIVVRTHQPMYSVGGNGDVNGYNHSTFTSTYGKLFDQYGVSLVISAHPRNYQRTFPVRFNPTTPSTPIVDPSSVGTSDYGNPNGVIYINAGTGGHSLDTLPFTTQPYVAFTDNADNGYLYVTITNTGTVMKGTFYNLSNNAIDRFSITETS